jgi:hypothetical protein
MATQCAAVRADRPGLSQRHRRCVRPQIPGLSPGGLGPHLTSSGFPRRAFLRSPVRPPGSSPSPAVLGFPFVRRSPVCSLRPSLPVPAPLRLPSGSPFPSATSTLAPPRSGTAGVGPGRPGPRSPVPPRPRLDRAIRELRSVRSGAPLSARISTGSVRPGQSVVHLASACRSAATADPVTVTRNQVSHHRSWSRQCPDRSRAWRPPRRPDAQPAARPWTWPTAQPTQWAGKFR